MDREEHRKELFAFVSDNSISRGQSKEFYKALSEALYSFNERGMFGDTHIDSNDALLIYALVKSVQDKGFPEELQM